MSATNDHDPNLHNGYVGISREDLEVMPDSELAQWQHNHRNEPPLVTLAEREWQRRIISHQLKEQFDLSARLAKAAEEHSANIAEANRKHADQIAKVNRWGGIGAAIVSVTGTLLGVWLGKQWEPNRQSVAPQESASISIAPTQPPASSKSATSAANTTTVQPEKKAHSTLPPTPNPAVNRILRESRARPVTSTLRLFKKSWHDACNTSGQGDRNHGPLQTPRPQQPAAAGGLV